MLGAHSLPELAARRSGLRLDGPLRGLGEDVRNGACSTRKVIPDAIVPSCRIMAEKASLDAQGEQVSVLQIEAQTHGLAGEGR